MTEPRRMAARRGGGCDGVRHAGAAPPASACHARSVSATLHACAVAAARYERRVAVEDLGDRSRRRSRRDGGASAREQRPRRRAIAVDSCVRQRERSEQPAPHGALVVRATARQLGAAAGRTVRSYDWGRDSGNPYEVRR